MNNSPTITDATQQTNSAPGAPVNRHRVPVMVVSIMFTMYSWNCDGICEILGQDFPYSTYPVGFMMTMLCTVHGWPQ